MEALLYEEQNSFTLEKNSTMYGNEQMRLNFSEDWKMGCKREADFDVGCLLRSPDMTIPSPELEQFFIRGIDNNTKCNTSEILSGDYNASQVTEEQESFVRGFTDALQKLYHEEKQSNVPLDSNSNIASMSKSHDENSKYTFINYHFNSSERLPPFSEAFTESLEVRKKRSVPSIASRKTELTFAEAMERFEAGRTEILNWDSSSSKAAASDQDSCLEQVVLESEGEGNQEMTILDVHGEGSYGSVSSNFQVDEDSVVFEADPISLSLENAKLDLESVEADLESNHQNEIGGSTGVSTERSLMYDQATSSEADVTHPQTENILESLSSFYDNNSDYSISSPSTSEYSNYEVQQLWEEPDSDEVCRDMLGTASGELFGLEPDFEESMSGAISQLPVEPTNKHWLSIHTKLYGMGAYSQQNEMAQDLLEGGGDKYASVRPMNFSVQDFVKTQRKRRKNRLAAWKCRQKKLIRESCLESKVEELCYQNAKLLEELERLKKKRRALEESFVQHASSGCHEAQEQYHQHAFNPIST